MSDRKFVGWYVNGSVRYAIDILTEMANMLYDIGIGVRVDKIRLRLITDNVVVKLICGDIYSREPYRFNGYRFEECFEFSREDTCRFRIDHNPDNNFRGYLVEYIVKVEKKNGKCASR